jgi:murein endopeptidase
LDVEIPAGAESVGSPNRGRITHAVQMPASPLWTLRLPDYAWGSTHALTVVADAIAQMRASTGWNGTWVISSISKQGGGRFRPHKSHQSGRDFDIRLPVLPGRGVAEGGLADAEDIDWDATWALVSTLADSGHVTYVFLERRLQPRLADAARAAGVPDERIAQLVQSERGREDPLPLVKHERGHDHHIHVRVACGPDERRCRD